MRPWLIIPKKRKVEDLHSYLTPKNDTLQQKVSADVSLRIKREIAVLHDTGERPILIENIFRALATIPPTSVEAERAFSAAGLLLTKIRSHLSDEAIDKLCFLRRHFLNKQ